MNKKDIIDMFRKGNSKNYIVNTVYTSKKIDNKDYTKQEAQEYVEMTLCSWWKTLESEVIV